MFNYTKKIVITSLHIYIAYFFGAYVIYYNLKFIQFVQFVMSNDVQCKSSTDILI